MMQELFDALLLGLAQINDATTDLQQPLQQATQQLTETSSAPMALSQAQAQEGGMLHFIAQSDWVGKSLFAVLVIMSIASWYLILVKGFISFRLKRRSKK